MPIVVKSYLQSASDLGGDVSSNGAYLVSLDLIDFLVYLMLDDVRRRCSLALLSIGDSERQARREGGTLLKTRSG